VGLVMVTAIEEEPWRILQLNQRQEQEQEQRQQGQQGQQEEQGCSSLEEDWCLRCSLHHLIRDLFGRITEEGYTC
jgi:hypothetical protein